MTKTMRAALLAGIGTLCVWGWFQEDQPPEQGIEWWAQSREARRANAVAAAQAVKDALVPSAMASGVAR